MFQSEPTNMETFSESFQRVSGIRKGFTRSALPLTARAKSHSILLLRVLLRKHGLAENVRRRAIEQTTGPSKILGQAGDGYVQDVPKLDARRLSREGLERVLRWRVPVVLEGAGLGSNAVGKWSPEYLSREYGDVRLPMFPEHSSQAFMTVSECMDEILRSDGDPQIQVNNVCSLFTARPGLLEELPIRMLARLTESVRYHGANLFVCRGGGGSKFHCANELNLYCQVFGEKEWFFVHPRHTPQMDPLFTAPKGNYFASGVAWGEVPAEVLVGRALLRPGDVLVNPPWWWHWVRNRDTTIGVATRWLSWRHRFGTDNAYFSLLQWLFPHQWKIMWQDYLRGGMLDEHKWVHADPVAD